MQSTDPNEQKHRVSQAGDVSVLVVVRPRRSPMYWTGRAAVSVLYWELVHQWVHRSHMTGQRARQPDWPLIQPPRASSASFSSSSASSTPIHNLDEFRDPSSTRHGPWYTPHELLRVLSL